MEAADGGCAFIFGDAEFIDMHNDPMYFDASGRSSNTPSVNFNIRSFVKFHLRQRSSFNSSEDAGSYTSLIGGNYIPSMAVLMRKSAVIEAGLYDEDYALEDLSMWLKLTRRSRARFLDRPLVRYRLHSHNSIQVLKRRLLCDTIRLLLRERGYCRAHELSESWDARILQLTRLLLENNPSIPLSVLMHRSFAISLVSAALRRSLRKLR
jgi:hypothetical protein